MTRSLLIAAMYLCFTAVAYGQAANDYSQADNWLCRPGTASDACAVDLTTTVVAADGTATRETFAASPGAPIDCFYVYPTVSADQGANSDMTIDPAEQNVVRQQFARFGSQCRTFAPMYRQVTLRGLMGALSSGARLTLDEGLGYTDVLDAWHHYLKHDNNGRGVVLVGHSQGAMVLTRLIAEEIDGKPMQARLVSAMLLGTTIHVPKGKEVGGTFKQIPLCRAADQIGCLVTFATFRSTLQPPANSLFGRPAGDGLEAACTNPAALGGGSGALRAYLTGQGSLIASAVPQKIQWVKDGALVDTPFVSVPGLLTAECAANEHANFLEITVHADAADPRADDIPGDLGMLGKPQPQWGLHLIDVNLAMGNLLDLVGRQSKAYLAKNRPTPAANDYGRAEHWLCRPGGQDACAVDLTTTVIGEDGRMTPEKFVRHSDPPVDCFYVYPTVSLDPGSNSDMTAGPEERNVVRAQFARFTAACRPYAPLYRQFTLAALRAGTAGSPIATDRVLVYNDVLAAWKHYLTNDNNGRGVVLIGHSQGAGVLTQLIRNEIDGKPVQARVVSAMLLGTNVAVPRGKDVGGAFQHMPLCRAADQIGCVVTYVSFRSTVPPPSSARFGRVAEAGMEAGCTNPAALGGGKAALHAYLSTAEHQWVTPAETVNTPFVSVPRLLSAQCVARDGASYLEITVNEDSHDPRADEIPGDVMTGGQPNPSWGLHLIDVHAAMGDLVALVGKQARAYLEKTR